MTRTFATLVPLTLQDPSLGERWRALREANRLSQEEAAARVGCSVRTMIGIESGRTERSAWMPDLATLYGVNFHFVLRPFVHIDRKADPEPDWMSIGEAVKRRRERMGWMRLEFATDTETTYQRLRRLEEEDRLPPRDDLDRIAAQLGVSVEDDLLLRPARGGDGWRAMTDDEIAELRRPMANGDDDADCA